ncbi:MAG: acyltransferase [Deltaproteobacteria bacterium]|nr:acyltransferase [Deltaproteobacteria bacterium]
MQQLRPPRDVPSPASAAAGEDRRLESIDALRGVGIVAVVALHTSWALLHPSLLASDGGRLLATLHLGAAFGVPLFLGLSAFGLARRHDFRREGAAAFATFLARRGRQLLPAYMVWSLLSAAARNPALVATPGRVLSLLIDGSAGAQFYFVPTLFELYVLWPLLGLLVPRRGHAARAALIAAGAVVSLAVWRGMLPLAWTSPGSFALYIAGGMVAATLRPPSRHAGMLALLVALLAAAAVTLRLDVARFLSASGGSSGAMALASTIFQPLPAAYTCAVIVSLALAAAVAAPSAPRRLAAALGRRAYGIFLSHLLLAQLLIHPLLGGALAPDPGAAAAAVRFAVELAATLAGSAAITFALARRARTRWLVGAE